MDPEFRNRRPSLVFPLLLVAAGILFLLTNLNILPGTFWDMAVRFWPVLFIVFGLDAIYRGEGLVGSTFITGLGIIFLLINLGYLAGDIWDILFKFWPIFIVLAGLDILLRRFLRTGMGVAFGLVVVVAVLAGILWYTGLQTPPNQALRTKDLIIPLNGAKQAQIQLKPAVGSIHITSSSDQSNLAKGTLRVGSFDRIAASDTVQDGTAIYQLETQGVGTVVNVGPNTSASWDLAINQEIPLDLAFQLGVGEATLDLTKLKMTGVDAEVAIGQISLALPSQGSFNVRLHGAIGQLVLVVPQGLPVNIKVNRGITSLNFPSDFTQSGDNIQSPEFHGQANHVEVSLDQAIGSILIRR